MHQHMKTGERGWTCGRRRTSPKLIRATGAVYLRKANSLRISDFWNLKIRLTIDWYSTTSDDDHGSLSPRLYFCHQGKRRPQGRLTMRDCEADIRTSH
jgi:hypothetical protein